MAATLSKTLTQTRADRRLYEQEAAILEVTELIAKLMAEQGVSKAELAQRLGRSRAYVTQLLDGGRNMTIRTVSDVLFALDRRLQLSGGWLDGVEWSVQSGGRDWPLRAVRLERSEADGGPGAGGIAA